MGYSTTFETHFKIEPVVPSELVDYIKRFSETRRMKRDPEKISALHNGHGNQYCYNSNAGVDGEYYASNEGNFGQNKDDSIVDYNTPPSTQPGLWCDFLVSDDGSQLIWNEGEKTYHAVEWVRYLIDNFLKPNGHVVNGIAYCAGEYDDDRWQISIKDNVVTSIGD